MKTKTTLTLLFAVLPAFSGWAQETYRLSNATAEAQITIENNHLSGERLALKGQDIFLETDAGFRVDLMWSHWRAPGKKNNGDNELNLRNQDFSLKHAQNDGQQLQLVFDGPGTITAQIIYTLDEKSNYLRKQIQLADSTYGEHFLQGIAVTDARIIQHPEKVENHGGFGQPVAFTIPSGSMFAGLEYPTATNKLNTGHKTHITAYQYFGKQIGKSPVTTETFVMALFPDKAIKHHFMEYVEQIAVTPARPYTLYNSWYDLRAADYPRPVPDEYVMNEENVFRIIDLIKENMMDKHDIRLDAFVLDDGWDVYESDWQLREEQFPNGMKPIADKLKETDTDLGIWFGPTGGYSARMKRINWMKEHGYEAVNNEYRYNAAYLCLAGKKYSDLFRKRAVDFVEDDDVRYFKWDGIQFSCSAPDHGHPVGVYSRRAVMESVVEKCEAVRENHPDVYLNITSGTWLSPWWTKYASQIWMDGGDYGWADLPSYSRRDAAITYRDFVLYDDFKQKELWFPISHLMTHGIIKGNLQMLGGTDEPLDKFTDNAMLYVARGVSMYELYISPTILNNEEWEAISQSLKWARENFETLSTTHMIGGNPTKGEPYGYVHFNGDEGIVALRNPYVDKNSISVALSRNYGLNPDAASLVVERIYPTSYIEPELYAEGASLSLELGAYETSVYRVYPLNKASRPLITDMVFEEDFSGKNMELAVIASGENPGILNPECIDGAENYQRLTEFLEKASQKRANPYVLTSSVSEMKPGKKSARFEIDLDLSAGSRENTFAVLLHPAKGFETVENPLLSVKVNGKELKGYRNGDPVKEDMKSKTGEKVWFTYPLHESENTIELELTHERSWRGSLELFAMGKQKSGLQRITLPLKQSPEKSVAPPKPWKSGETGQTRKIGTVEVKIGR